MSIVDGCAGILDRSIPYGSMPKPHFKWGHVESDEALRKLHVFDAI
jgi:hypothetical protein